jgi:hypothetical protein
MIAEGLRLRRGRESPPVGCRRSGRRQSASLRQQSHSTRVVVGVEILRHTSAYKRNPLFRRRAPASSTADPGGVSWRLVHKAPGDPSGKGENHRSAGRMTRPSKRTPSFSPRHTRRRDTCHCRRRRHVWDALRAAGRSERLQHCGPMKVRQQTSRPRVKPAFGRCTHHRAHGNQRNTSGLCDWYRLESVAEAIVGAVQ